jgi:hypothetical protein
MFELGRFTNHPPTKNQIIFEWFLIGFLFICFISIIIYKINGGVE